MAAYIRGHEYAYWVRGFPDGEVHFLYLGQLNAEEKLRKVIKNLKGLIPNVKQNLRDSHIRTFEKAIEDLETNLIFFFLIFTF